MMMIAGEFHIFYDTGKDPIGAEKVIFLGEKEGYIALTEWLQSLPEKIGATILRFEWMRPFKVPTRKPRTRKTRTRKAKKGSH